MKIMSELLAHIIPLARKDDVDSWMNILFVVVLAVFWIVGGIIKAKKNKPKAQDDEQLPLKPAHRPPARSKSLLEQFLEQARGPVKPAQRRPSRPGVQQPTSKLAALRSVAQKYAAEVEQAARLQTTKPTPEPELSPPEPHIQPDIRELPEFTDKAVKKLQAKRVPIPAEIADSRHLSEILSDYSDPDELRRAILHYEILGKPLSLRYPSGNIIGF
jgi:hypothetical protein